MDVSREWTRSNLKNEDELNKIQIEIAIYLWLNSKTKVSNNMHADSSPDLALNPRLGLGIDVKKLYGLIWPTETLYLYAY